MCYTMSNKATMFSRIKDTLVELGGTDGNGKYQINNNNFANL